MKNKVYLALSSVLCSVFLAVGVFLLLTNLLVIKHSFEAQFWKKYPAKVLSYKLQIKPTAGQVLSSKVQALYEYTIDGITIRSETVEWGNFYTNYGAERKAAQLAALEKGVVYVSVNPQKQTQAVFDNTIPIETLTLNSVFIVFPCFIGFFFLAGFLKRLCYNVFINHQPIRQILCIATDCVLYGSFLISPILIIVLFSQALSTASVTAFSIIFIVVLTVWLRYHQNKKTRLY